MKIPNKQQLQQIAFNHLSDIDFKDFMNLYKSLYHKTTLFFYFEYISKKLGEKTDDLSIRIYIKK